jgi:serine/threonine-protein kinase
MFKRESKMLEQLKILSVVPQFIEYFEEQGKPYFTMEFITGTDLLKLMEPQNKPFPVDKVVNWSIQLCDVFSFLHRQNPPIVFRGLKPENIMLTKGVGGERIVLVDFGIAREMDVTGHTMTKGIGTQAYMFEEMVQGKAEPKSDLFTLAATMFHLLTNQWPESTATPRLRSVSPGMPQWLDDIIAINLSRLPADRYNSASELMFDLQKQSISTTRTCSRCQAINQIREPYCQKCGTQLSNDSRSCPNCRQSIPRNAKFCIHCGYKLAA